MDDAFLVRRLQPVRHLLGDGESLLEWKSALADALGERRAFHELEDEGVLLEPIDRADVRMIE